MAYSIETSAEEVSRVALSRFLSQAGVDIRARLNPYASVVEDSVQTITSTWNIGDRGVPLPLLFSATSASPQLLLLCIDDFACSKDALAEFADRFFAGHSQLHPILDQLAEVIRDTKNHFLPIVANRINRSLMEFIDTSILDLDMEKVVLHPGAFNYILDKRRKNGVAYGFALFTWDKERFPDPTKYLQALTELEMYITYANDILSFYKEELAGEQTNFVHERAKVNSQSVTDALYDTVNDAITSAVATREMLKGTLEGDICEAVMGAYAQWHLVEPRYRLGEIIGNDIKELL